VHPNIEQRDDGSTVAIGGEMFVPAERHRGLYGGARIARRPNYGRPPARKPALERRVGELPPLGPGTVTPDETILGRQRALAAVDDGLGELLKALSETGQLDRTVVVFAGDNGYFYGEHGLSDERRLAYEESARIPLVVRYPPLARAGSRPGELVLNIDLAPTALELAGVAIPAEVDGRSLVPILAGRAQTWRRSFLIEYYTDTVFPRVFRMGYDAVRTERWKYIRYRELEGMDELYDLRVDPYEMRNLAASAASTVRLKELRAELDRLQQH
jgi:N-acetylglucosamine-6-sulfatase